MQVSAALNGVKTKQEVEQFKRQQQEKDPRTSKILKTKNFEQTKRSLSNRKGKALRLIKSVAKNHEIRLYDTQVRGVHFMIKEKCSNISVDPDDNIFIKRNVLNVKEQE